MSVQGALCYAELGCSYVSSGGDYTYLRVAFGDFVGFLRVWIEVALSRPMIVVLSVLTASNYLVYWFYPNCTPPPSLSKCLSLVLLLIVGFINLSSSLWTDRLHQICNYFKIGRVTAVSGNQHLLTFSSSLNFDRDLCWFLSNGFGSGGELCWALRRFYLYKPRQGILRRSFPVLRMVTQR